MNNQNSHAARAGQPPLAPEEEAQIRASKVADLKRKVESGTYLIKQYEIIEGLLNSMAKTLE